MIGQILIVIAGIFAALILAGLFIPRRYRFHKTIIIRADKKHIFNTVDELRTWSTWSQWSPDRDPGISITYGASTAGVHGKMEWKGKKMGAGSLEITATEPYKSIALQSAFNKGLFKMEFLFTLEDIRDGETALKWTVSGLTKRGGFAKILGRLLPRMMGRDMETALTILKHYCEGTLRTA